MYFALPSLLCFQNVSDFIIRDLVILHPLCFPCLFRFSRNGHRGQGSPAFCSPLHPWPLAPRAPPCQLLRESWRARELHGPLSLVGIRACSQL